MSSADHHYHPPAHVVAAVLVERDHRFLLVEERVQNRLVVNQPAGHWESGETLVEAARREALEETGWDVDVEALLGVYQYRPPQMPHGFLRFAFIAKAMRHHPERALDVSIERALWLSRDELESRHAEHRSPMVMHCVDDYLAGRRFPLELIAHLQI